MTTEELLPCPFCGDEGAESQGYRADGSPWPYIECLGCGASAEPDMWNRRTPPTDALVEALKSVKWDCENCDWHCINCGHNQGMTETDLYNAVCRALDGQTPQSGKKEDGWLPIKRSERIDPRPPNMVYEQRLDDGQWFQYTLPPLPSPPASKAEGE